MHWSLAYMSVNIYSLCYLKVYVGNYYHLQNRKINILSCFLLPSLKTYWSRILDNSYVCLIIPKFFVHPDQALPRSQTTASGRLLWRIRPNTPVVSGYIRAVKRSYFDVHGNIQQRLLPHINVINRKHP